MKEEDKIADFEDLVEEIKANARRDRQRLEKVADELIEGDHSSPEDVAMISDSLTKSNAQLLEVAKLEIKKQHNTDNVDDFPFDGEDKENIFDTIKKDESDDDMN